MSELVDKLKRDIFLSDTAKEACVKLNIGNCKELVERWFFAKTQDIFKGQRDLADAFLWDAHNKINFNSRLMSR